jgi:hypothetical protein
MSLLQELGAQLSATSEELPTGLATVARERLRSATELLNWVRQQSQDPMGVPQLGNAVEHAEHAAAALRAAQDAIATYLSTLGLPTPTTRPACSPRTPTTRPPRVRRRPRPSSSAPGGSSVCRS